MAGEELIEALYCRRRDLGGQRAQLDEDFSDAELVSSFGATTRDLAVLRAMGPFIPEGTRKPLIELARRADLPSHGVMDTADLQSILWQPPRWSVTGRPDLDFEFLARELTPVSSATAKDRVWLVEDSRRHLSLDALLVNSDDRAPIVAEIKVGGDENAELALIQALASTAQLSSPSQLKRVHRQYRDALGSTQPTRYDVYVITAQPPTAGVRIDLAERARARAIRVMATGALSQWVRRIVFLEATVTERRPTFRCRSEAVGAA